MDNREQRNRDIGLFRYSLIREAADTALSPRQRGVLVRALAAVEHQGPSGNYAKVSRPTLDRWIRSYRAGGFDALVPKPRRGSPAVSAELLALAVTQKKAAPGRSAVAIAVQVRASGQEGKAPSARTLQRHFAALGLKASPDGAPPRSYGRFEAEGANDLWTGDALHGPIVGGHKAYLFAFIDDHARLLAGYRWGHAEDTVRLEAALHRGLASRGVPAALYVDNGSPFASRWLLRACASLGIRLVHSAPGHLDQRVGLRYHLDGLDAAETAAYVKHHLGLVGRTDALFSEDAVALIHQTSRGLPRAVNNLAVAALVAAYAGNKAIVDESSARSAVAEVTAE